MNKTETEKETKTCNMRAQVTSQPVDFSTKGDNFRTKKDKY